MSASRGVIRRASSGVRFGFLGLLRAGGDTLEADIVQAEVLGIGAQDHASLGDMRVGIEFLSLEHDLALEAGLFSLPRRPNSTISPLATSFLAISAARLSTEATSM